MGGRADLHPDLVPNAAVEATVRAVLSGRGGCCDPAFLASVSAERLHQGGVQRRISGFERPKQKAGRIFFVSCWSVQPLCPGGGSCNHGTQYSRGLVVPFCQASAHSVWD